ncbi:MAG TPA: patatin-like phospholipase family protein [Clostridiales bacterium]|nr:MAG: NTE family protein RssA [Firmicutes bacterium ADurb.Bin262]HOU10153.1 patatin-like phospholipase family protein [Clostridiales bacterium]HQK72823.1 patatin-like phospholipase family protein [Clostridiales bacterium]
MVKRAVVFSGGGAKGGYQIGVWQVLNEIGYIPDIVTGTSIGAINGALLALGKYDEALELWENIDLENSLQIFEGNASAGAENREERSPKFFRQIVLEGGVDCSPMFRKIAALVDEAQLRSSNVDYGLVTTTLPARKPIELFLENIPQGQLHDYIFASASAYPFLKSRKIGDRTYIDGGYADNLPVKMALERGAGEIVAVNIGKMAVKEIPANDARIHFIHNRRPLSPSNIGKLKEFTSEHSRRNIRQGTLDAKKAFGLLDGHVYAFERYEKYKICYFDTTCSEKYKSVFSDFTSSSMLEKTALKNVSVFFAQFGTDPLAFNSNVLHCAETAAEIFDLDQTEIYTLASMCSLLIERSKALLSENTSESLGKMTRLLDKGLSLELVRSLVAQLDKKLLLGFCLQLLLEERLELRRKRWLWAVSAIVPDCFCAALFCCSAILNAAEFTESELLDKNKATEENR